MRPKTLVSVVLILSLAMSTGCSWLMMKPVPRDYHPSDKPLCGGYAGLVFDTVFSGLGVAGTTGAVLAAVEEKSVRAHNVVFGVGYFLLSVVFIASGVYGFQCIKECTVATSSHEDWIDEFKAPLP